MTKTLLVAVCVLSSWGCAAETDDTDKNKTFTVDGYVEVPPVSPPTDLTTCSYGLAQAGGATGIVFGQVVPVSHRWEGFRPADPNPSFFDVSELYDCDGSKGIHAIIFDTSRFQ